MHCEETIFSALSANPNFLYNRRFRYTPNLFPPTPNLFPPEKQRPMSRKRVSNKTIDAPSVPSAESILKSEPMNNIRAIRETLEALVIALVLAFFFKAFTAEAFVIPTGSMATTLMGRHKDINCGQCGFAFQISASEESNDGADVPGRERALATVMAGTCPLCRYTTYVGPNPLDDKINLSYSGDRIFVNKSQFDFREPQRWHVTVFHYPARPQMNYIKRLVGEENETVMLRHGDVFVKKDGEETFTIQRKPLRALLAMLRPVDDNDYVIPALHELGWPTRWFDDHGHWSRTDDYKTFTIDDSAASADPGVCWLQFRNIVASSNDWFDLSKKTLPEPSPHRQQLITDFLGYNSGITKADDSEYSVDTQSLISIREVKDGEQKRKEYFCKANPQGMGLNWVGDLALSCRVRVEKAEGDFLLQLVKGGTRFLCRIDLKSGDAELSIPDLTDESGAGPFILTTASTPVRAGKTVQLLFCNIDEELRLIVDGTEIDFGLENRYDVLCEPGAPLPRDRAPTQADLTPAAIGVHGAAVTVDGLKIQRDMYYIACSHQGDTVCDLEQSPFAGEYLTEHLLRRVFATPEYWTYFGKTRTKVFKLDKDEFLMLGDNSAKSKDGRLWTSDGIPHYVKREMLIGEALFVYWPHGIRIPGTRLALIPNVKKFRFID